MIKFDHHRQHLKENVNIALTRLPYVSQILALNHFRFNKSSFYICLLPLLHAYNTL